MDTGSRGSEYSNEDGASRLGYVAAMGTRHFLNEAMGAHRLMAAERRRRSPGVTVLRVPVAKAVEEELAVVDGC